MKENMLSRTGLAIILLLLVGGCKSRKEIIKSSVVKAPSEHSKSDRLNAIRATQIDFNTMAIKAKADITLDNNNNEVTLNIRIQKNQIIWVSVTVFAGLEVARALITPDSVKVLNRFENSYIQKPFTFIHQFVHKEINFQMLQAILLGNTLPEWISDTSQINIEGDKIRLSGGSKSLLYDLGFNQSNRLEKAQLSDKDVNQNLLINYADFSTTLGKDIPRHIDMYSQLDKGYFKLDLRYAKVDIDESLTFPFTVPRRFSVKN